MARIRMGPGAAGVIWGLGWKGINRLKAAFALKLDVLLI